MSPKNIEKNQLSEEASRKLHKWVAQKLPKYADKLVKSQQTKGA